MKAVILIRKQFKDKSVFEDILECLNVENNGRESVLIYAKAVENIDKKELQSEV